MPDIKISEVARLTGLSMRYWQRRALRAWPPTFPSKNNAKRKNLTRNSRESRKTVGRDIILVKPWSEAVC